MPKFYCDYCLVFLSHSSPGGRKQHCKEARQTAFMPKFNNLGGGGGGGGMGGPAAAFGAGGIGGMGPGGALGFPGAAGADFQQIPLQHPPPLPSTSQGGAIKPAQAMPLPTMNNSELNLVNVENDQMI